MEHSNRKIKGVLITTFVVLIAFISFSKAGIIFTAKDNNVITVSTKNKTFEPKNYVASVGKIIEKEEITETTTITTTTKETTTMTTTTASTTVPTTTLPANDWTGDVLSKSKGVVYGPSGKETYYNLNMSGVVRAMRYLGFTEEEYPYWVREDGVKMLGGYVMVAASYNVHPKGSIVPSSLGQAIVCDTGGFAQNNPNQLDIAVTW